jgi:hypothetical protein
MSVVAVSLTGLALTAQSASAGVSYELDPSCVVAGVDGVPFPTSHFRYASCEPLLDPGPTP